MSKIDNVFKYHYTIAFFVTLLVSISLIVGGFFCPPMGEVSGSVLTAVGELFLWVAIALGAKALSEGKDITVHKGDLEVNIGGDDNDDNC